MNKYFLLLITTMILWSCVDENPDDDRYENSVIPMNNEIVFEKQLFGAGKSYFRNIIKGENGFYVLASLDNSNTTANSQVGGTEINYILDPKIIKFDGNGQEVITITPNISIYDVDVIPRGLIDNNEYILVSGYDENESDPDDPDRTRLMLYDSDMTIVSTFERDFFQTINDFKLVSNSNNSLIYIGVGAVWISGISYPCIFEFEINKSTKEITYKNHWRFSDYNQDGETDDEFRNMEFYDVFLRNNDLVLNGIMTSNNNEIRRIEIMTIGLNNIPVLKSWKAYGNDNDPFYLRPGLSILHNSNLIVIGSLEDEDKEKDRNSPFVLNYNVSSEDDEFYKVIRESDNPDYFDNAVYIDGKVMACGIQSRYYSTSSDHNEATVGNGWFYSINVENGNKISEFTFGSKFNRTRIRDFIIGDNYIWAVGLEGTNLDLYSAALYKIKKSIIN